MTVQENFDITSAYMREMGSHKLFDRDSETAAFQSLERAAARLMSLIEGDPELKKFVSEVPRQLVADRAALMRWVDFDGPPSRDALSTALKRATALLEEVEKWEEQVANAADESSLSAALKGKYFGIQDTAIGSKLMREALEHPRAVELGAGALIAALNSARNRIIESNMRLVTHIAKRYLNRGMTMLDLVQEGSLGLMRASSKFEWRKGYKFSTYAVWWIKQSVVRALDEKSSDVRVPVHQHEILRRAARETRAFESLHGRKPQIDELESLVGVKRDVYESAYNGSRKPLSFDAPIVEGSDHSLVEMFEDESSPNPQDVCEKKSVAKIINRALKSLHPREEEILTLRYGLRDGNPMTLEQIAEVFGLTRERIRQIEKHALKSLTSSEANVKLSVLL